MPVLLEDPDEGGPIQVYAGDPKTIIVRLADQDRTNHYFTASVRQRPATEDVIATFDVTAVLDSGDTVVTCVLGGDSAEGELDGQTRLIKTTAWGDIQEWDEAGKPVETIAKFQLKHVEDVTK